jgi:hypothetical protein
VKPMIDRKICGQTHDQQQDFPSSSNLCPHIRYMSVSSLPY